MLSIPMMVRVGPWKIVRREHVKEWSNCERCGEPILDIYICEVEPEQIEKLKVLNGQRVWRIGSECGPKLEGLSDFTWKLGKSDANLHVSRAERYKTLVEVAEQAGHTLSDKIHEYGKAVLAGNLDDVRLLKHFGLLMHDQEKALGIDKKKRRKG